MTDQFKCALLRALLGATLAGAVVFFTALGDETQSWRAVISLTGAAVVSYAGLRGLVEGAYDSWRQSRGDVRPSDVQRPASTAGSWTVTTGTSGTSDTPPPNRPGR